MTKLTAADWVEIYYALDTKIDTVKTLNADILENRRWLKHLQNIMTTIGPDGQYMMGKS